MTLNKDDSIRFEFALPSSQAINGIGEVAPDFNGLDAVQARHLSNITEAMEERMKKELGQYLGMANTPENIQKIQTEMIKGMEKELYDSIKTPSPDVALSQKELLRVINRDEILARAFEVFEFEDILWHLVYQLGRIPTTNAMHRTLEFIHSTTHPDTDPVDYDPDDFDSIIAITSDRDNRPRHQKEIDFLIEQMNQLIFVSKARLILNDYPESVSISVQMSPSIEEHEAETAMQAFEDLLTDYKPKGLVELEVSITNKVVY